MLNGSLKIYFFIGTTAELIRISPIIKELKKRRIRFKIITSGQVKIHFEDMAGYVKNLKPDIAFKEKAKKSSMLHFSLWAIKTFFTALIRLRKEFKGLDKNKSYFVICGDPVSTSIGALIASIYGLKIVHIESGDLSFNLLEPFPEEICRNINLFLADILFPPSQWANDNLKRIHKLKVNTYYNTLLEGFNWALRKKTPEAGFVKGKKYYILIMHRQEHVFFRKDWARETLRLVIENANPDLTCVLFNYPITVKIVNTLNINPATKSKILISSPLPYSSFLNLMKNSEFITTDGATNQYEAYLMGKPCLILRDYTEQIEGIGKNVVLYKSNEQTLKMFLQNYKKFKFKPITSKIRPSKIIVDYLYRLAQI